MLRVREGREADEAAVRRFAPDVGDWSVLVSAVGPLVAVRDEEPVGLVVRWPHPDHVLLERVAVAPHERRAGVGTVLLRAVEAEAARSGVPVRARATGGHVPLLLARGWSATGDGLLERRP